MCACVQHKEWSKEFASFQLLQNTRARQALRETVPTSEASVLRWWRVEELLRVLTRDFTLVSKGERKGTGTHGPLRHVPSPSCATTSQQALGPGTKPVGT